MKKFVLSLVFILNSSCQFSDEVNSKSQNYFKADNYLIDSKFEIPSKLWDHLEGIFQNESEYGYKVAESTHIPKELIPINVELIEKTSGVLDGRNIFVELPGGGAALDLAHFVIPGRGTFFLKFSFNLPSEVISKIHFLYLSNSRQRNIDGNPHGSGCHRFFDVSRYMQQTLLSGIQVNTTNQRYVSVLAGTFVIALVLEEVLYLSHVVLYDSRYPHLHCEEDVVKN